MPSASPSPAVLTVPTATPAAVPAGRRTGLGGGLAVAFVALFGLLLASFPARNPDVWGHLAAGRDLAGGAVAAATPTWLHDLATYAVFRIGGGAALVGAKAVAVGGMAVLMLLAARRPGRGWGLPAACVGLAVLAAGTRLGLQPATASCAFLALTVWLLRDEDDGTAGVWPGWRPVALFLLWANVDGGVLLGLGVVALTWLGRSLDGRGHRFGAVAVLAAVCLLNPAHVRVFAPLAEVIPAVRTALGPADAPRPFPSPFDRPVFEAYRQVPAGLAVYALLGVGLVSFVAAARRGAWRWGRFLPWLGLAAAAAVQARAVPFFAVVAGPVLAWNLQDVFAARPAMPRRGRAALGLLGVLVGAAVLAAAWPGWLQRPPFGARRWAVEEPAGLKAGAAFVREAAWPAGTRTLHLTADGGASDTAAAFAWFAPDDPRLVDDDLAGLLLADADPADRLRAAGVGRVVVWVADRGRPERVLRRLLLEPDRWPLLSVRGGVAVFGWRDPARTDDPYRGREVLFDRLGFRPVQDERAPEARPTRGSGQWYDALRRSVPARTGDADEAALLLVQAEALRRGAPARKLAGWEATQVGGLVAAAAGWAGANGPADAALRLALTRPPVDARSVPPVAVTVLELRRQFEIGRDDIPPGLLYAAVRAARRAVAADPADATAYLSLGEAYLGLLVQTGERVWAVQLHQLGRLREVQAVTALTRAAALNPNLAPAHRALAGLYQQPGFNCLDLAADHLRAYRDLAVRSGRLTPEGRAALDEEVAALDGRVAKLTAEWEAEVGRASVARRADAAARRGLGGKARDTLLASHVSAFGPEGTELELDLLLRTGRADDVLAWATEETRPTLGAVNYLWLRAQAQAAAGEYAAADDELADLADLRGGRPEPRAIAGVVAYLVGKGLADDLPGGTGLPHVVWRTLGRNDFQSQVSRVSEALAVHGDTATLRGLLALEAGDIDRARADLRAALAFSPPGGGGLLFTARPVARAALDRLEAAGR